MDAHERAIDTANEYFRLSREALSNYQRPHDATALALQGLLRLAIDQAGGDVL